MAAISYSPSMPVRRPAPVRLTRRGRLVAATLLVSLYLLLSAAVVALGATASRAGDSSAPVRTVVVQRHDTLWSIVERHVDTRDPVDAVERIRRANSLDGYVVHPGQELVVPLG